MVLNSNLGILILVVGLASAIELDTDVIRHIGSKALDKIAASFITAGQSFTNLVNADEEDWQSTLNEIDPAFDDLGNEMKKVAENILIIKSAFAAPCAKGDVCLSVPSETVKNIDNLLSQVAESLKCLYDENGINLNEGLYELKKKMMDNNEFQNLSQILFKLSAALKSVSELIPAKTPPGLAKVETFLNLFAVAVSGIAARFADLAKEYDRLTNSVIDILEERENGGVVGTDRADIFFEVFLPRVKQIAKDLNFIGLLLK